MTTKLMIRIYKQFIFNFIQSEVHFNELKNASSNHFELFFGMKDMIITMQSIGLSHNLDREMVFS